MTTKTKRWKGPLPDADWIDDFENGRMTIEESLEGLQHLIDTHGWEQLQGMYGRCIRDLFAAGDLTDTHGAFGHLN